MTEQFAEQVFQNHQQHSAAFPSKRRAHQFCDDLLELLFPHFAAEEEYFTRQEIDGKLALLSSDLRKILRPLEPKLSRAPREIVRDFFEALPDIYRKLWLDAHAIEEGDPAAESLHEVIAAYPGFFAICTHRIAHVLYQDDVPILPRIMTEHAHVRTGVDIHPGATIGESFCIDHGTGVVIGETTVIGDHVKLYQGVSLGALSVSKEQAKKKRHPTIENNVVVYSNATILGGQTIIGHDSVIGGNVFLTESVPPHSVVYHTSEIKVRSKTPGVEPINFVI
ncbi:MAG: serine acetyltransferase [Acidobacteriota bacterium]|nr:MAG: serine acetyltransferase [Acidobacteriota bacterium]